MLTVVVLDKETEKLEVIKAVSVGSVMLYIIIHNLMSFVPFHADQLNICALKMW